MNKPTTALMRAFLDEARPFIRELREDGWPVEVIVVDEPTFLGVRLEVPLDGLRLPVREGEPDTYEGPPLSTVSFS